MWNENLKGYFSAIFVAQARVAYPKTNWRIGKNDPLKHPINSGSYRPLFS